MLPNKQRAPLATRKYITGVMEANADQNYKKLGYAVCTEIVTKTNPDSPDYDGFIDVYGLGKFKFALWVKERIVIDTTQPKEEPTK
jgi:hypothetical protein